MCAKLLAVTGNYMREKTFHCTCFLIHDYSRNVCGIIHTLIQLYPLLLRPQNYKQ